MAAPPQGPSSFSHLGRTSCIVHLCRCGAWHAGTHRRRSEPPRSHLLRRDACGLARGCTHLCRSGSSRTLGTFGILACRHTCSPQQAIQELVAPWHFSLREVARTSLPQLATEESVASVQAFRPHRDRAACWRRRAPSVVASSTPKPECALLDSQACRRPACRWPQASASRRVVRVVAPHRAAMVRALQSPAPRWQRQQGPVVRVTERPSRPASR